MKSGAQTIPFNPPTWNHLRFATWTVWCWRLGKAFRSPVLMKQAVGLRLDRSWLLL